MRVIEVSIPYRMEPPVRVVVTGEDNALAVSSSIFLQRAKPFPHRHHSLDMDHMGVVDQAVDDRVGDRALAELRGPCASAELRAEHGLAGPGHALDHLQDLARLVGLGVLQQPVIDDEQVALDVALLALEPLLVLLGAKVVQHLRQPHVSDRVEVVACGHAQRAPHPCLSVMKKIT